MHNDFQSTHPLVKVVKRDNGYFLAYDAKASMLLFLSPEELHSLDAPESGLLKRLNAAGIFMPGGWTEMFDSSPENIARLVAKNSRNILMRKFVLEVTQACNFRCTYCANTLETVWRHHATRHMSAETARKAIDYYYTIYMNFFKEVPADCRDRFLKNFGSSIGFYGGEPTMNWRVVEESCRYFRQLDWPRLRDGTGCLTITCNTNLSFLTDKMIDFLVDNDIMLFASLDGPENQHDLTRKDASGKGTFARTYSNLMRLKEKHPGYYEKHVSILAVESPEYDREVTHEFLDSLGCGISYLEMSPFGCFIDDVERKIGVLSDSVNEIVEDNVVEYDKNPEKSLPGYLTWGDLSLDRPKLGDCANSLPTCPAGTDNMMVDVDGNFHVCHKTDGSFILGNVDDGLDHAKVAEFYRLLADEVERRGCRDCWAYKHCGQCAATRLHGGSFTSPSDRECDFIRKVTETELLSFARIYDRHPDVIERMKALKENPDKHQGLMDLETVKWENFRK